MASKTLTIFSVASPEPKIVSVDSDSKEPSVPYAFGNQQAIVPPSLNDLKLPHNPFNVLATMAVIRPDETNSPPLPELSISSPISTPPMNLGTIEGWQKTHKTTDDNTFHSEDEPKRVYWSGSPSETFDTIEPRHVSFASSPSSTTPPPRRQKKKLSIGMSF